MAVSWSTTELEKIEKQSLGDLAPYFYYIPTKSMRQIEYDMEGYLILQPKDQKQKLLDWIKNVTKIEMDNVERDSLLSTYISIRLEDASARIEEIDTILNKYSELQGELLAGSDDPSRFAAIIDLNEMIRSISRTVDSISIQRDQAFHERNLTNDLKLLLDGFKSSGETQEELKSWQSVISAYPGQKAKSGNSSNSGLKSDLF